MQPRLSVVLATGYVEHQKYPKLEQLGQFPHAMTARGYDVLLSVGGWWNFAGGYEHEWIREGFHMGFHCLKNWKGWELLESAMMAPTINVSRPKRFARDTRSIPLVGPFLACGMVGCWAVLLLGFQLACIVTIGGWDRQHKRDVSFWGGRGSGRRHVAIDNMSRGALSRQTQDIFVQIGSVQVCDRNR
jgi:hypothetical protein